MAFSVAAAGTSLIRNITPVSKSYCGVLGGALFLMSEVPVYCTEWGVHHHGVQRRCRR